MPSPIGHSLLGLWFYALYHRYFKGWGLRRALISIIIVANIPDIDAIPGLIFCKNIFVYHHYFTHSFVFALLVSCLVAFFLSDKREKLLPVWTFFFLLIVSHLLADLMTEGETTKYQKGIQLFYPFSEKFFHSSRYIFYSFGQGVLSYLKKVLFEIVLLGIPLALFLTIPWKNKEKINSRPNTR